MGKFACRLAIRTTERERQREGIIGDKGVGQIIVRRCTQWPMAAINQARGDFTDFLPPTTSRPDGSFVTVVYCLPLLTDDPTTCECVCVCVREIKTKKKKEIYMSSPLLYTSLSTHTNHLLLTQLISPRPCEIPFF